LLARKAKIAPNLSVDIAEWPKMACVHIGDTGLNRRQLFVSSDKRIECIPENIILSGIGAKSHGFANKLLNVGWKGVCHW
jgi:hypothetical protein